MLMVDDEISYIYPFLNIQSMKTIHTQEDFFSSFGKLHMTLYDIWSPKDMRMFASKL